MEGAMPPPPQVGPDRGPGLGPRWTLVFLADPGPGPGDLKKYNPGLRPVPVFWSNRPRPRPLSRSSEKKKPEPGIKKNAKQEKFSNHEE